MLSTSESNDGQKPTQAILEESKAKRDATSDYLLKNSIKNGNNLNFTDFNEILIFYFFNSNRELNFDQKRYPLHPQP